MHLLFILLGLLILPSIAAAAPDLSRLADTGVLTRPSSAYRFHTLPLTSADGARHYRVYIGVPHVPPPAAGFVTLYALDGNAVLEELAEIRLQHIATHNPTVLVLIGYATDKRFDAAARAFDYTPPVNGKAVADALDPQRHNGGADEFLDMLQTQIMPAVARIAPVNTQQQSLWGHSYGGLLVLHTLFTRPQLFRHYIAADPSLWWQNGVMLQQAAAFNPQTALPLPRTLTLLHSGKPTPKNAATPQQQQRLAQRLRHSAQTGSNATAQLAQQLHRSTTLTTQYRSYPQLSHGELLPLSFQAALGLPETHLLRNSKPTILQSIPADE